MNLEAKKNHATACAWRRTSVIGNTHPVDPRLFRLSRMGLYSEFRSSRSYAPDTTVGRSCYFPDTLVHGAGGILAAVALQHVRVLLASARVAQTGADNHYVW